MTTSTAPAARSGQAEGAGSSRPVGPRVADCRPGTLASDLRISLARISRRLRSERGEAELTEGQYGVLSTLYKRGPMSPGAIAERERVRPPQMTRAVNTLAEMGLVAKSEHPTDGRQVVVTLTAAGEDEVRETRRRRDAWLTRQLATLSPQERSVLAQANVLMTTIAER